MRAITIRFPDNLATDAQSESQAAGESINQLVVDAVAAALDRRRANRALARMCERIERMRQQGRVGKPSEPLIRKLREGHGRRG